MPRRRGRPVMRTAGRTAVIAGTATAVSGRVARRQQQKAVAQQQGLPSPEAAAAAAPAAASIDDELEELKKLAELKDQGILTEEEFAAKKAQILGL